MANIDWQNLPSETTPINSTNLNVMSAGLVNISTEADNTYRVNLLEGNNLFKGSLFIGIINEGGDYSGVNTRITNANSTTMKTFILKKGTYTVDVPGLDYCAVITKNESGTRVDDFADSWKALPFTFTTTQDAYIYISARKSDNSVLSPNDYSFILQEGSTIEPIQYNQILVDNDKYSDTLNVGQLDSRSRVNVLYSKNLFNKNTALLNTGMDSSTGLPTTQSNVFLSDFIKVEPNTDYYISGGITSVYGYSISKSYISEIVNSAGAKTFNSGNAEYVRVKSWYASSSGEMQTQLNNSLMNIGTSAIPYEPFTQRKILVDNEKYTDTLNVGSVEDSRSRVNVLKSKNLFDKNNFKYGYAWNTTANSSTAVCYIKCKPNTNYSINYTGIDSSLSFAWIEKESENSTDRTITHYDVTNNSTFTTSSTSKYIVIQFSKANISSSDLTNVNMMINEGSSALPYEPYITPSIYVDNEEIYSKENPTNYISSVNLLTNKTLSSNDNQVYVNNSKFVSLNITLNITGAISSGSNLIILPEIARPKKANLSLMAKLKSGGNYYVINCWCRTDGTLAFQHTSNLANGDEVAIIGTYYALN